MIETTRPELVAYQEERLAKFVNENQKLDKGQIVFAGDSITEFFALKKYLGRDFPLVNRGIAGTDSVWLLGCMPFGTFDKKSLRLLKNQNRYKYVLGSYRLHQAFRLHRYHPA